ncbi:MAG: LysR-family transcriptional regulator [Glaciihabitans sp.]|nr:LysR-family transcriptional regulator [Glaciihabitans sp.]
MASVKLARMTDLELRHLAAMAAIAEEGSFGRAAARLGYTQSTVSQQIAALERAVGGSVFDRPGGPRPVRITPLGAVVLGQGRAVLAKAEALADAVDRFKAGDGRIDIGTFQSVSSVILPSVVRRLRDEHPGCDIRLSEEEPDLPQIGDLDLLFYDGPIDGEVEHIKLLDDPYLLVAAAGTFPEGPVSLQRLDNEPMVAWPLTCDQPDMEQALARGGAHPQVVFRTAVNDTLLSMVRAGLGSAALPWLAIRGADVPSDDRLRVHELQPPVPPREIYLHWRAGRTHSPLARRAIEIAVEVAAELRPPPASA